MKNIHCQKEYLPESYCDLHFEQPVTRWDEAIPLGNGIMGCLVWGGGFPLRLSLDRGDLWDERKAPEISDPGYTYKEMIKLVKSSEHEAIQKRFCEFYTRPTPTKIPAGAIELDYGMKSSVIESRLYMADALCEINMKFGEQSSVVKTFLHAEEFFGYITISGNADMPEILLKAPDYSGSSVEEGPVGLTSLGYPAAIYTKEGNLSWFHQKTCDTFEYALVVAQKKTGEGCLEAAYIVATNQDGDCWLEDAKNKVFKAVEAGFERVFSRHQKWWESFWLKSSITICDKEYEKMWYRSNYLLGSCSRKGSPPMPLQGVWTADDGGLPPWKGDYHHDLNTQMSYWHYMKANHIEEGESFIDFLWQLVPEAERFAKDFFDAPGICLPSVVSISGKSLGGWPMYCTNLVNQIWLCQAFEHYWRYTGDDKFLVEKAYPYFKSTAQCILRWLEPDDNGKLVLPLSSSPEIHDDTPEAWLKPNSNNDLSLLIYLFATLAEMSGMLGNREKIFWKEKLCQLPKLAVDENKVLMLSPDEQLKESHRHHSHSMAIYPLKLLKYNREKDREIIDATIANLELLGTGLWVGFSFTWMANLYALQGNGEGAAYQLKLFFENFCSLNGFNLNGDYKKRGVSWWHYRPFTLEANMCAADALQEMLLDTDKGIIKVFPAIPEEWKRKGVAFRNLRGWNGILVSSEMASSNVVFIQLEATRDGVYIVNNCFDHEEHAVEIRDEMITIHCHRGSNFELELAKGEKCRIYSS